MARKYLSPLNLLNLTSDPGTATEGDFYWNSSSNKLRIYFDGAWGDANTLPTNIAYKDAANTFTTAQTITPATSLTGLTINAAASSKGLIVKANATTPGSLQEWQDSSGTAILSVSSTADLTSSGNRSVRFSYHQNVGGTGSYLDFATVSNSATILQRVTTAVGLIVRGAASQTADLIQAQNSGGSVVFKVSPTGVINAGTSTTIGNILNFSDPGVGVETRFNFLRASDSAWLAVNEMTSDSTYYEFGMADNPSGGDYFQWRFDNYEAPAHGWMPLQMSGYLTRFTAASNTMYGNFALPYNTPYAMINNAAFNAANLNVNKYTPTQNTSQSLFKDAGTGTGTVTLNAQSYTGSTRSGYWIEIEAGGITFKWGTGYTANTPTATGVSITGVGQTLNNGVSVTISTTGHVAGDRWSFVVNPRNTVAIGGSPIAGAMQIVYPSAAVIGSVIRGATSQTANLQEWQDSASTVLATIAPSGTLVLGGTSVLNSTFGLTLLNKTQGHYNTGNNTNMVSIIAVARGNSTGSWMSLNQTGDGSNGVASLDIANGASTKVLSVGQSGNTVITNTSTSVVPLTINSVASQTADLQQWKNSAGSNVGLISATGGAQFAGLNVQMTGSANVNIGTAITTGVGLIIRGVASQTADLQQWQNTGGTVISKVDASGNLTAASFVKTSGTSSQFLKADGSVDSSTYLTTGTASSTYQPLDTDLTAIAALASGTGLLKNTAGTWSLDTSSYLTTGTASSTYAPLASPSLTGTPLSTTAAVDTNTTQIATTAFVIGQGYLKSTTAASTYLTTATAASTYLPLTGGTISSDLTITGSLTVNGTTTNLNSTNLVIEDKNIIIADVASPTNTTADGAGITIKGATDKTFNWVNATGAFTSSEPLSAPSITLTNSRTYGFTRTLPTTVDNIVELGSSTLANGGGTFEISVVVPSSSFSVAKQYLVPVNYDETANNWRIVNPIADGGQFTSNDFTLEVNVFQALASFRLRRSLGTTAGTAYISMKVNGNAPVFTESSGTASVTAPTTYYNGAVITQKDGAATINGNLTATQLIRSGGTSSQFLKADGSVDSSTYLTTGTASSTYQPLDSDLTAIAGLASGTGLLKNTAGTWSLDTSSYLTTGTASSTYAPIASPSLTGTPLSTTAAADTNTTQIATTAYVIGQASNANPVALGTVSSGTSLKYSRADHVHPTTGLALLTGAAFTGAITSSYTGGTAHFSATNTSNTNTEYNLILIGVNDTGTKAVHYVNSSTRVTDGAANSYTIRNDGGQLNLGAAAYQTNLIGSSIVSSAQIQSTLTGSTTNGQIYLNGATSNRIDFNINGVGAPSFTNRSTGTKIVLYPNISGSTVDYAIGIDNSTLWQSVLNSTGSFKWYAGTTQVASLSGSGLFTAVSKSFDIEHPTKPDMRLRYGSLEGPENGVYVRGNTKENVIELPEYWTGLVDESTITVSLTSIGKFQKVYLEKIEGNKIYIGGRVKEISYVVFGERKDIDKITVEY